MLNLGVFPQAVRFYDSEKLILNSNKNISQKTQIFQKETELHFITKDLALLD